MKFKKYIPYLLIFHPRGLLGKAGPYVFITLMVIAIPFLLSKQARDGLLSLISPQEISQQQPQISQQAPSPSPLQGFDPLRLQGAWAVTNTDTQRGAQSWSQAKSVAADIWEDQLPGEGLYNSFYCGCTIERTGPSSGETDFTSCGYQDNGNRNRARRLEWEHIMPASYFGQNRQCWQQGAAQCVDSQGEAFAGRRCCEIADPLFQMMSNDPVNLVPSTGEVNGDRSNYPFTLLGNTGQTYGQCQMRIDSTLRAAEPPASRRGDIARIYGYMSTAYGIPIPRAQGELYKQWMVEDPVSQEELRINQAIRDAGHRANPLVLGP